MGMDADELIAAAAAVRDDVLDRRRWFHAHPELSFAEHATTAAIRDRMAELGAREERAGTDTGAVFTIDGGRPGLTVLVRADIDALPVHEPEGLGFRSVHDGVMHACGHDAHAAIALGAAAVVAARAEALPGRYVFVFQPGEERVDGARRMIEDGLLDRVGAQRAVGLHIAGFGIPAGYVVSRPGVLYAGASILTVDIAGPGGHGAMMERTGNVLLAAADLSRRLGEVATGLTFEGETARCTAGVLWAGAAANVVPTSARIEATLRTFTADHHAIATERLRVLCDAVAAEFEVEVVLERQSGTTPVRNDPASTAAVLGAAGRVLGPGQVFEGPVVTPSDDMSEFLDRVPGCYFLLGAQPPGSTVTHHSASFAIDEAALELGVRTLTAGALALAEPDQGYAPTE